MKKKVIIAVSLIVVLLSVLMIFGGSKTNKEVSIETKVKEGFFKVEVTTSGELEAENSTMIMGPPLSKIRIWNANIEKIIPEGSVVDSGEYVATIDASELTDKLNDAADGLEMSNNKYTNTVLDTTLELRQLRDNLINLEFVYEEAKIKLEQSKFEPPATIRQEEINMQKAQRASEQSIDNYRVKVKQANSKMREASINLNKAKRKLQRIEDLKEQLTVFAPKAGMVIYSKDWDGNKKKEGSRISAWNPIVAELPDLSVMISKTYINEIDISKVEVGQKVAVGIDAFPELELSGEVSSVANIGEQLKGSDAKVFEVTIKIFKTDSILRPSMTTSNSILISSFDSVLYVPIEAVFSNDSINWVIKPSGLSKVKQQVLVGDANDNEIIILKGVEAEEKLLISIPENEEELQLLQLNN